ncbi:DNA-3-methyladenine glycosylase [Tachyglossus aculeatus]|uniref:DNA-3-methyladenine glycosylase n=1 Tax=Tachyglossus aculeatus TaxID=9261 RepID=UPI0018F34AC6|nr:DNA-3-methyladenine glycosylase [Tachyglossus aculeatus]
MLRKRLRESAAEAGEPVRDEAPAAGVPAHRRPQPAPERSIYFTGESRLARLGMDFFNQPAIALARALLGQVLVRRLPDGQELRGRVVETEAYLGPEDRAAHSRGGKQTPRNKGMFMSPGTLYVYLIYGMHFCFNISSQGAGACVLLRALEPLEGLAAMRDHRRLRRRGGKALRDRDLCNGPAKLCQALAIDRTFDRRQLADDAALWMEPGAEPPGPGAVVAAARIGVEAAGDWALKPLRFYVRGHACVSVLDKEAERRLPGES